MNAVILNLLQSLCLTKSEGFTLSEALAFLPAAQPPIPMKAEICQQKEAASKQILAKAGMTAVCRLLFREFG
jgi:hypothetical protein